jgi:predicted dehydrogenase
MAREHARAFQAIPGVRVTGIHSRTRPRAEALAQELGIEAVYDSIEELYDRTQAGLVVVAVSELSMKETGIRCLRYPWFILLEKPAGLTVPEVEELASAAAERNRTDLAVAFNRRHYSATRAVLEDLSGRPESRHIRVLDQESRAAAKAHGYPDAVIEKWMYTNSIHLIDYFRLFARGNVTRIENIIRWNPANPGAVLSTLQFDSGDVGVYEAVWDTPGPWAVSVNIPGTRWEMRPLERAAVQHLGQAPVPFEVHEWDLSFKPGFRLQAEKAVQSRAGCATGLPTLADSLSTMRLVKQIYEPA